MFEKTLKTIGIVVFLLVATLAVDGWMSSWGQPVKDAGAIAHAPARNAVP